VSEVFPAFELTSYSMLAKNQALQVRDMWTCVWCHLSQLAVLTNNGMPLTPPCSQHVRIVPVQVIRALGSGLATIPADPADTRSPNQEPADRDCGREHDQGRRCSQLGNRHRTKIRSPADKAILTDIMYKLLSDREVSLEMRNHCVWSPLRIYDLARVCCRCCVHRSLPLLDTARV
jgi:hypothetical protein